MEPEKGENKSVSDTEINYVPTDTGVVDPAPTPPPGGDE